MAKRDSAEILTRHCLRCFLAELIGTFLLVLVGCMGCLGGWASGEPPAIQYSTSFGMVVMFVIQMFGHVSGAHINPVVTLSAVIFRSLSIVMAVVYVIAQIIGAILGYGMLILLTPEHAFANSTAFCVTMPAATVSAGQAVVIEAIITMVLIFVCCSVWDPCNSHNTDSVPIKFGFTIAAIAMSAGAYTGGSMNPARSLGPAIWNNAWTGHWIYWVGPILGSALATLLYCSVLKKEPKMAAQEEMPLQNRNKTDLA